MPLKQGHRLCVLALHQRDNWRRGFRVGQSFDDSEALHVRPEVNDSQINMLQSEAEDVERVLRATGLYFTTCAMVGKIIAVVTYQDNIPFHTLS